MQRILLKRNEVGALKGEVIVQWNLWGKSNIDGCAKGNHGPWGGAGGHRVAWWARGFSSNLGVCNSLSVELWAVMHGLDIAWIRGLNNALYLWRRILVCFAEPQMLLWRVLVGTLISLVHYYLALQAMEWQCKVVHIFRKANTRSRADHMANTLRCFPERCSG